MKLLEGLPLLPTTIVGSYPQPDWLIDRQKLGERLPPRVRADELWRIPGQWLDEAQRAATLVAISDQKTAGIDIIGDGEMRRESYSNRLANALEGIDIDEPGTAVDRTGAKNPVPRVSGPIRRARPIEAQDAQFLKERADTWVKITIPGPFTLTQQAQNDHYPDNESLAMDYADAINAEIRDLFAAGVDIVQIDEPYLQARPDEARDYAIPAINRALDGVGGATALHICFGYAHVHRGAEKPGGYAFLPELNDSLVDIISVEAAQPGLDPEILRGLPDKHIMYGVLDLNDPAIETPEIVAQRLRDALDHIDADRLIAAPDCGMKYHSREDSFAMLKAMAEGAAIARREVEGA